MKSNTAVALVAIAAAVVHAYDPDLEEVSSHFREAGIVPDVIPATDFRVLLDLGYDYYNETIVTRTGLNLTQTEASFIPEFSLRTPEEDFDVDREFVLIAVDPDAPYAGVDNSVAPVIHYLGGGYVLTGEAERGQILATNSTPVLEYTPPAPPANSTAHRYVWLLYAQTEEFSTQTFVNSTSSRLSFDLASFSETVSFGAPVGGTFYYVSTNPEEVGTSTGILSSTGSSSASSTAGDSNTSSTSSGDSSDQTTSAGQGGAAPRGAQVAWAAVAAAIVAPLFVL